MPAIVDLILNDESTEFGARLLRNIVEFIYRLINVLVLCVGRPVAGTFLVDMLMRALSSENRKSNSTYIFNNFGLSLFCVQNFRPDTSSALFET